MCSVSLLHRVISRRCSLQMVMHRLRCGGCGQEVNTSPVSFTYSPVHSRSGDLDICGYRYLRKTPANDTDLLLGTSR